MYAFIHAFKYCTRLMTSSSCGRMQLRSVGVRACTAKTFAPEFSSSSAHCNVFLMSTLSLQLSSAYSTCMHTSVLKIAHKHSYLYVRTYIRYVNIMVCIKSVTSHERSYNFTCIRSVYKVCMCVCIFLVTAKTLVFTLTGTDKFLHSVFTMSSAKCGRVMRAEPQHRLTE